MSLLQVNKYGAIAPRKGVKLIIPKITPDKAQDMWGVIEGLVQDYIRIHPQEVREVIEAVKVLRRETRSDTGATKNKSLRYGMCLPLGLELIIKRHYPEVFSEKRKFHKLMRLFPGFRVARKV
jgi:hypothetical protein